MLYPPHTELFNTKQIFTGKANILWPGLTAPILRGKELVEQQQLPEDPDREKKLIQLRDQMGTFKHAKLSPIERGWTGSKMPGRSIGPPDPVGEGIIQMLWCPWKMSIKFHHFR